MSKSHGGWVGFWIVTASLVFTAGVAGQTEDQLLTNESVLEMHALGLGEEVLLKKIENSLSRFDVSLTALKELKEAGLPDSVLAAMIEAGNSELAVAEAADPNDPLAPHPAGIYVARLVDDREILERLEPSVYSQTKTGGFLKSALTYGALKAKTRAVLAGSRSRHEISDPRPAFYFYFEETDSGLSSQAPVTTSPAEFILAEFTVREKKNARELVVAQMNAYGSQSGALDKTVRPFDFEELSPGIFKVYPIRPLPPGEYCFYYAGASPLPFFGFIGQQGGGKVFDFSIR